MQRNHVLTFIIFKLVDSVYFHVIFCQSVLIFIIVLVLSLLITFEAFSYFLFHFLGVLKVRNRKKENQFSIVRASAEVQQWYSNRGDGNSNSERTVQYVHYSLHLFFRARFRKTMRGLQRFEWCGVVCEEFIIYRVFGVTLFLE